MPVVANFWENEASEARSKRSVSRELRNKAHKTCCVRYLMRFLGRGLLLDTSGSALFSLVFFFFFCFCSRTIASYPWTGVLTSERVCMWKKKKRVTHQIHTHSRYAHLSNHQQTFCNFSDMFWDLQIFWKGFVRGGQRALYWDNPDWFARLSCTLATVQPTFQPLTIKTSNKSDLSISFC